MTDKEKEAIERMTRDYELAKSEDSIDIDIFTEDIRMVLNLVQTQQEEIEKKDRVIDEMVTYISNLDIDEDICMKNVASVELCNEEYSNCKECIKEYLINKVEKEK